MRLAAHGARVGCCAVGCGAGCVCGRSTRRFHLVARIGQVIAAAQRRAPRAGRAGPCVWGGALSVAGLALTAGGGSLVTRLCQRSSLIGAVAEAWALKLTFSARGLADAAQELLTALRWPDGLQEARRRLAWHLVSRDGHCRRWLACRCGYAAPAAAGVHVGGNRGIRAPVKPGPSGYFHR